MASKVDDHVNRRWATTSFLTESRVTESCGLTDSPNFFGITGGVEVGLHLPEVLPYSADCGNSSGNTVENTVIVNQEKKACTNDLFMTEAANDGKGKRKINYNSKNCSVFFYQSSI
ncbi:uncharacterized protein LOC134242697 [Saccostrea cucullata]|uniref:uncharacterized protein LOC134242697 n=1 Tax=Saccostrea cuccullata TaxID=36930 RepID=UPI002ED39FFF